MSKLIIFEGPDKVGKTTISKAVATMIGAKWISFPGKGADGSLGQHIYDVHHNPEKYAIDKLHPLSRQILHVAAHVELLDGQIRTWLEEGHDVVMDRCWWSTIVYGRYAGIAETVLQSLAFIDAYVLIPHKPDIFFLVKADIEKMPHNQKLLSLYTQLACEEVSANTVYNLANRYGRMDEVVIYAVGVIKDYAQYHKITNLAV